MDYLIGLLCILLSALFSGLTLGFFSLNKDDLNRKAKLGDLRARKIYRLRERGNLLLCTLLIGNVAVNSTFSIFLGSRISGVLAGVLATFLIVVFGEILPQAFFSRYALNFSSKFTWMVNIFIWVLFPICWPLAKILDKALGEEIYTVYSKRELIKIIEEHEDSADSDIDEDEERIIKGALSFSDKKVGDILTPRTAMFVLSSDRKLDAQTIAEISDSGHSRIPVYQDNPDNIIGTLYVKDLLKIDWQDKKVGDIARDDALFVDIDKKLDDLLNKFKETRHHLFVVLNSYGEISGLVTVEDVVEEIIGEEIVDEFDKYVDLQEMAKRRLKAKKIKRV